QAVRDRRMGSLGNRRPRVRRAHGCIRAEPRTDRVPLVLQQQARVDLGPVHEAAEPYRVPARHHASRRLTGAGAVSESQSTPEQTPYTDDEIEAMVIGEPPPTFQPVVLVDYDPEWPRLYAREESRIRGALGDRALLVEHAGSTSVPGLPAKRIVDIGLVVPDSSDENADGPSLQAAGYVPR